MHSLFFRFGSFQSKTITPATSIKTISYDAQFVEAEELTGCYDVNSFCIVLENGQRQDILYTAAPHFNFDFIYAYAIDTNTTNFFLHSVYPITRDDSHYTGYYKKNSLPFDLRSEAFQHNFSSNYHHKRTNPVSGKFFFYFFFIFFIFILFLFLFLYFYFIFIFYFFFYFFIFILFLFYFFPTVPHPTNYLPPSKIGFGSQRLLNLAFKLNVLPAPQFSADFTVALYPLVWGVSIDGSPFTRFRRPDVPSNFFYFYLFLFFYFYYFYYFLFLKKKFIFIKPSSIQPELQLTGLMFHLDKLLISLCTIMISSLVIKIKIKTKIKQNKK